MCAAAFLPDSKEKPLEYCYFFVFFGCSLTSWKGGNQTECDTRVVGVQYYVFIRIKLLCFSFVYFLIVIKQWVMVFFFVVVLLILDVIFKTGVSGVHQQA